MQLKSAYEDVRTIYAEYASEYRQKLWFIQHILGVQRLRQSLFSRAQGRILEIACGTGENFPYFAHATALTAVDLSPDMLEQAKNEAQRLRLTADFQVMPAEALDFADASFDTVVSTLATCTFCDPVQALREMGRVCQPNGRILLIEHGASRWAWLAAYQERHAPQHFAATRCRWNQEPLELVQASGLKIHAAQRHLLGIFHTIEAQPA